jgi:hypothetical protein
MKHLLTFLSILLAGCNAAQPLYTSKEAAIGKTPGSSQYFIVKKNGETMNVTEIKHRKTESGIMDEEYLFVDGQKMYFRDMNAYQEPSGYFAIHFDEKHKHGIRLERLRVGRISLYVHSFTMIKNIGMIII